VSLQSTASVNPGPFHIRANLTTLVTKLKVCSS
jgi:hypothetical protein